MAENQIETHSIIVTVRVREFAIPPVTDGLVLGKSSPIGATAMKKALALLQASAFDHIKIKDDVIGDIFVRSNILKRISRKQISTLAIDRIKPIMNVNEIMHLSIDAELIVEEQL
ncbi:MAG: hypothetical protein IID46_01855 [Planctomycetes bacterium]|nr:hypothetical protein [Planctomycetota bacterium]